ncbi:dynein light chain Tctex-type protein 2 [Passerculus sandwichensis]
MASRREEIFTQLSALSHDRRPEQNLHDRCYGPGTGGAVTFAGSAGWPWQKRGRAGLSPPVPALSRGPARGPAPPWPPPAPLPLPARSASRPARGQGPGRRTPPSGTAAAAAEDAGRKRQDKDMSKVKKPQDASGSAPTEGKAKSKSRNTYRLEPRTKVQDDLLQDKAQAILTNKLRYATYDGASSAFLCASISEEILNAVKELNYDRYKYVVSVLIVEKANQAMIVASRCLWDAQRDTWVSAKCETDTFIALALVMACYYD